MWQQKTPDPAVTAAVRDALGAIWQAHGPRHRGVVRPFDRLVSSPPKHHALRAVATLEPDEADKLGALFACVLPELAWEMFVRRPDVTGRAFLDAWAAFARADKRLSSWGIFSYAARGSRGAPALSFRPLPSESPLSVPEDNEVLLASRVAPPTT